MSTPSPAASRAARVGATSISCSLMWRKPCESARSTLVATTFGLGVADQAGVAGQPRHAGSAQQLVHRLACGLARDIPQRDVDARQAEDHRPAAPEDVQLLLQLQHQAFDRERVAAHAHGRDHLVDRGLGGRNDVVAERLAPAGEPLRRS